MNGVFTGNCYEAYRNIPQKSPMKKFTEKFSEKNSLTDKCFFRTSTANSNN